MKKRLSLSIIAITLSMVICSSALCNQVEHSAGFGIGLPYGGVTGVNYELGLNDYFAPVVGIGVLPDNIGWNVGARVYYPGREAKVRGRLTALYGTNTLLETSTLGSKDYETEEGFSGGLGVNWRFAEHWAFDADVFVVDSDVPAGYTQEGSDVKGAIGFSYRW